MKRILISLTIVLLFCNCNAQSYRVQKAQAFFTVATPGMQMVDENGKPVNPEQIIDRFIYIECRFNGKPKIDSVFYNGILYTATVADKEETVLKIGVKQENGKPVTLSRVKGNHIWRIELSQPEGKNIKHEAVKKIILKGRLDKTKFSYTIIGETQLTTPDRY